MPSYALAETQVICALKSICLYWSLSLHSEVRNLLILKISLFGENVTGKMAEQSTYIQDNMYKLEFWETVIWGNFVIKKK